MAKYIPYNYNQDLMIVVNLQDQLQAGTFEHALHYLVTKKLFSCCFCVFLLYLILAIKGK
jgi:hypothetical protein